VKIAAAVDARNRSGSGPQFTYFAINQLRVEREPCVSVRSGYDISGTGFSRYFQHRDRVLQNHWAIVDTRQNMTMDIDYIECYRRTGIGRS
jgi:hypothetical protein